MRFSSVCVIVLAVCVASSSGCKVGRRPGVSTGRSVTKGLFCRSARVNTEINRVATRGTAKNCDCYTCRKKRQKSECYIIRDSLQPIEGAFETTVDDVFESDQTDPVVQPFAEPNTVEPPVVAPVTEDPAPVPTETPRQQEVQGEIIEDQDLSNELPATDAGTSELAPESQTEETESEPLLDSPSTLSKPVVNEPTSSPIVHSTPIPAKKVSAPPTEPVFQLKSKSKPIATPTKPPTETKPKRGHSIWFAPFEEPKPKLKNKSKQLKNVTPKVAPASNDAPTKKHEVRSRSVKKSIVLQARPVDRHVIYNGQPTHAPIRQARLPENAQQQLTYQNLSPDKAYFYELPPIEQRWNFPDPSPQDETNDSQPKDHAFRPLPKTEQSNMRFTKPVARLIKPETPMLRLNAVPAGAEPETLPPIVSIQSQQEAEVIGALQVPNVETTQINPPTIGLNRLHTTPWKPMSLGPKGNVQIESSIRNLTIRTGDGEVQFGGTVNR